MEIVARSNTDRLRAIGAGQVFVYLCILADIGIGVGVDDIHRSRHCDTGCAPTNRSRVGLDVVLIGCGYRHPANPAGISVEFSAPCSSGVGVSGSIFVIIDGIHIRRADLTFVRQRACTFIFRGLRIDSRRSNRSRISVRGEMSIGRIQPGGITIPSDRSPLTDECFGFLVDYSHRGRSTYAGASAHS